MKIYASQDWVQEKLKNKIVDWGQNDPNCDGYINNRPFYTNITVRDEIIPETTVTLSNGSGSAYASDTAKLINFARDTDYKVIFDGEEYIVKSVGLQNGCALGNLALWLESGISNDVYPTDGNYPDTGEPFLIVCNDYYSAYNRYYATTSGDHTYNVYKVIVDIKQIDKKFLPGVDWMQNDSSAADYVKNRTHWDEEVITEIFNPGECTVTGTYYDNSQFYYGFGAIPFEIVAGRTYRVNYCNTYIDIVADNSNWLSWTNDDGYFGIGSTNTNPYWYGPNSGSSAIPFTTTITIEEFGDPIIHQLDEKYIPDTIARVSDIPELPTIDATLIVEGAAADAKATGDAISAVSALVGDVAVSEQISSALAESAIPTPTTAQVGQILAVKAVDENGKPTDWETVDPATIFEEFGFTVDENGTLVGGAVGGGASSSGFELVDRTTGDKYNVYVDNGKLTMEVV